MSAADKTTPDVTEQEEEEGIGRMEAERVVEEMSKTMYGVRELGTGGWMKHHALLSRINQQAHINLSHGHGHDEYITEAFTALIQPLHVLIHDLLCNELWRQSIVPRIQPLLKQSTAKLSLVAFHECVAVNLLELMLFEQDTCAALGDSSIDLLAYCKRRLFELAKRKDVNKDNNNEDEDVMKRVEFSCQMGAVSILRLLSCFPGRLPPSAVLVLTSDDFTGVLSAFTQVLEMRPWERRNSTTKTLQSWNPSDGTWKDYSSSSPASSSLHQTEAQVWLALTNLMVDQEWMGRTKGTTNVMKLKEVAGRIKRKLRDDLVDMIPVLADLRKTLDFISMINDNNNVSGLPSESEIKASVMIEPVEQIREALLKSVTGKWDQVIEIQTKILTSTSTEGLEEITKLFSSSSSSSIKEDHQQQEQEEEKGEPNEEDVKVKCGGCGVSEGTTKDGNIVVKLKRCSKCKSEWYCSAECQLKKWPKHKPICLKISQQLSKLS